MPNYDPAKYRKDAQTVGEKKTGWELSPYCVMGIAGCVAGLLAFMKKR